MSPTGSKRLVINSDRFFTDICPVVLREIRLGSDEDDDAQRLPGDSELYDVIKRGNHRVILTPQIQREYRHTARSFPQIEWLSVVQHLLDQELIINPRRLIPFGRRIEGIRQRHITFPIMAIRTRADYLITEYPPWRDSPQLIEQHGPTVITPGRFILNENR